MINYYVDPGSGFVFVQNTSLIWGLILGLLGTFFIFFRLFFKFFKRFLWIICILFAAVIIGGIIMQMGKTGKKVIILGIDAMDPQITEQLIREERLPNFSNLKTKGSYSRLTTTIPSESVVAWSSFMTGLNPGSHGIFDFIMRNPHDYQPYLSLNEILNERGRVRIHKRRKGLSFWDFLSKNRIPSQIYFCPNTFPSEPVFGKMLSGMGVPDILGTMGRLSFYTTKALSEEDKDSRGRIIPLEMRNNVINTNIYGPRITSGNAVVESEKPLKIIIDAGKEAATFEFSGNRLLLKKGDWSSWQRVSFKIGPFKKVNGIVRFYLKSIHPEFELYASPINFDPQRPPFPISYPRNYSNKLAQKLGLYYTQGMPHDTWALTENRLDEEAFLEHVDIILEEKMRILDEELSRFQKGAFFFYIDVLDPVQHMFWRYLDQRHPLHETGTKYQDTILKYYEKIDQILGKVLKRIDQDTTLIVLSDHGFAPFRKSVHLNRWLKEFGFLFLKEGQKEGGEFFEDVDWSKTKAYSLGFGGIYLNKIGRERYGIVNESEAADFKQTLEEGLRQFKDPINAEMVVKNVYNQEDAFQGPYIYDAPDLFVGFNMGYRASWQTALGGIPSLIIEDNRKKWSGDHLIDPDLVPGVIFMNRKTGLNNPSIIDIAPTILYLFGITDTKGMQGENLLKYEKK